MNKIDLKQFEIEEVSVKKRLLSIIESLLFVSGEPLKLKEIASILECNVKFIEELMKEAEKNYEEENRGIKLLQINDTYQLVTKNENSDFIQKLLKVNVRQSLSQAALETLAIIAYKQPITRIDVDEIRGVRSDKAVQNLVQRNLIKECGRLEVPGKPILYRTTDEFLKQLGVENLQQMPSLDKILDDFGGEIKQVNKK